MNKITFRQLLLDILLYVDLSHGKTEGEEKVRKRRGKRDEIKLKTEWGTFRDAIRETSVEYRVSVCTESKAYLTSTRRSTGKLFFKKSMIREERNSMVLIPLLKPNILSGRRLFLSQSKRFLIMDSLILQKNRGKLTW